MKTLASRVIKKDGVLVVAFKTDSTPQEGCLLFSESSKSDEGDRKRWTELFPVICKMLDMADTAFPTKQTYRGSQVDTLRLVLQDEIVNLQKSDQDYLMMVSPKGHPIAKSIQRMFRRGFRKARLGFSETESFV